MKNLMELIRPRTKRLRHGSPPLPCPFWEGGTQGAKAIWARSAEWIAPREGWGEEHDSTQVSSLETIRQLLSTVIKHFRSGIFTYHKHLRIATIPQKCVTIIYINSRIYCRNPMNIRQQLPLEQQFELKVFENQVRQLSQEEAHDLLIHLREMMLYQTTSFREILKESWGIGKEADISFTLLGEG
jgi:hypothetical protein